eukprot:scaffold2407_cov57-Cyclotella_meneghiniana.AAC.11
MLSTVARRAIVQGTKRYYYAANTCSIQTTTTAWRRYGTSGWMGMPIKMIDMLLLLLGFAGKRRRELAGAF